jgi:hypothetical protein
MNPLTYFLVFIPLSVWAQNNDPGFEDFNGDGYTDTLRAFYNGGSGFGGKFCELTNGATHEKYELDTWGCFCQIKRTIIIPEVLRKTENRMFLKAMEQEVLPEKRNKPDPSLRWIINANSSNYILSDNIYFDLIIYAPPEWISGKIELPDTYCIDIGGNVLNKLYIRETEPPYFDDYTEDEGWVVYYGHNHYRNPSGDSLTLADSSLSYKVYITSHGLVIKKEDSYAWMFVNDFDVTGGPQKLRWESIKKAQIFENHIFIQQSLRPDSESRIWVIDIETGTSVRMKAKTYSFLIENGQLLMEDEGEEKSFLLKNIFKELRAQDGQH